MNPGYVVRAKRPAIAAAELQTAHEARAEFNTSAETWIDEHLGDGWQPWILTNVNNSVFLVGAHGYEATPEHWRAGKRRHVIVPRRSTPQGKAIDNSMNEVRHVYPNIDGLGGYWTTRDPVTDQGYFAGWRFQVVGDDVFGALSHPPEDRGSRNPQVIPDTWEVVPLSVYHLARETSGVPA